MHEEINYEDIYDSGEIIVDLLYLRGISQRQAKYFKESSNLSAVCIPNTEVKTSLSEFP